MQRLYGPEVAGASSSLTKAKEHVPFSFGRRLLSISISPSVEILPPPFETSLAGDALLFFPGETPVSAFLLDRFLRDGGIFNTPLFRKKRLISRNMS